MANKLLPVDALFTLLGLCLQVLAKTAPKSWTSTPPGQEINFDCSIYTFHMKSKITWENSKNLCEQSGSKLVSMERLRAELSFLTNQSETLKMNTTEYYIGLKKYGQKWIWISDNSTLEETEKGEFPWHTLQPSGNGNCAKMWREESTSPWTYLYDDVECTSMSTRKTGYICEKPSTSLECSSDERTSKSPKLPKSTAPSPIGGSFAGTATVQRSISSSQSQSTTKNFKPYTIKGSTTMVTKTIVPEGIIHESPDFTAIILILVAVIILVVLIVSFLIFARRRRNNKTKDARREIAERIQLENQGSSLNPTQNAVATQVSGMSGEIGDGRHELETTRQPRRTDCAYTMLSQYTMTQSERVYASLTACESVNSNRNRPCNKSPIYVNQGLAFLPGLNNN